jgi:predicted CoA-binding protein
VGDPALDVTTPIAFASTGYACLLPTDGPTYPDALLLEIYRRAGTVAMVGASPTWNRPSYFVMRYLQRKGFRVIPVNPRAVDAPILGETVYPDLESIPVPVDVVDVFRRPEETPDIARSAAAIGASVLWLQLGIRSAEAVTIAEAAGLTAIEDHCMKIEYGRLSGELAWSGINTRTITSRRGSPLR